MLSTQNLIWSKGVSDNEYSKKQTESSSDENEIICMIENMPRPTQRGCGCACGWRWLHRSSWRCERPPRETNITTPIIFIRNNGTLHDSDLYLFANNLHKLTSPCILITSDGDSSTPSSYQEEFCYKILNHRNIVKWYAQNYDKSILHPKLRHYPIGFNLHTNRWLIDNSIEKKLII